MCCGVLLYLWFEVPVHHANIMHVADGRHQSAHDTAGLRLAEVLLPSDPLQQLSTSQELQNEICV